MKKNPKKWLKEFNEFNSFSNEKDTLLKLIKKNISTIKNKKKFLDYGAGSCQLTNQLSSFFKKTIAVDRNKFSKDYLTKEALFFLTKELDKKKTKFDFILLSHVLGTNFEKNRNLLNKIIKKLNNNGIICIVSLFEESDLKPEFKQVWGAMNYFNELVLKTNNFKIKTKIVTANYSIPENKKILFNSLEINKLINKSSIKNKTINFKIKHKLIFAKI